MYPLIFGGAFFAQIDLCAAATVNRFLYDSKTAETAVTHKIEGLSFLKPCYVGDIIFLHGKILPKELRHKAIVVEVTAEREKPGSSKRDKVASAKLVFISIEDRECVKNRPDYLPYVYHEMSVEHEDHH